MGNTTILTASSTGLTLIPTTNVNINVTNSTATFGGGNVSRPSVSFTGNTSTGMYMPLANTIAFATAGAETMRITAAGNFGVGVTSPQARIHSTKAGAELARFTNSNSNGGDWELKIGGGGFEDRRFMITDRYSGADTVRVGIDSSGNFQFNSGYGSAATAYGCRAWVNFNGTTNTAGFCTIRASGNVTSVADNGTGDYTVNFTTAMPDADYVTTGTCSGSDSSSSTVAVLNTKLTSGLTNTSCRLFSTNISGSAADRAFMAVAVFR